MPPQLSAAAAASRAVQIAGADELPDEQKPVAAHQPYPQALHQPLPSAPSQPQPPPMALEPFRPKPKPVGRVECICNQLVGTFDAAGITIELADGNILSPTDFERQAGKAASKKWKSSIRVHKVRAGCSWRITCSAQAASAGHHALASRCQLDPISALAQQAANAEACFCRCVWA